MKRYNIQGNPDKKLGFKDVIESETGEWVRWEDAKWYTPEFKLIDYPEITQEENEARYQESLSEGN